MSPGNLILSLVGQIEAAGIPCVYLRNHENLPDDVGNDVDLLIQKGETIKALAIISAEAPKYGWKVLRTVQFSPLSVFLAADNGELLMHIDLFERIEWHCVEYAESQRIIDRRQWNGRVHIPNPADELYLNISTRLIYQGKVREKHRLQAKALINQGMQEAIRESFAHHMGHKHGIGMADAVIKGEWQQLEASAATLRRSASMRYSVLSPMATLMSLYRYSRRSISRIVFPPGPFVVFEGADGVGKSTVIEGILPLFKELTGRSDTLLFHWKPNKASLRIAGQSAGAASDPRGKHPRPVPLSLLFIAYHWLGFWIGYFRHVLPARVKNRSVIGDRYSYEFFLDPKRLRLQLPKWLLKVASMTVPKPDMALGLLADPGKIVARKNELSKSEIDAYQANLLKLFKDVKHIHYLHAEGSIEENVKTARLHILKHL